VVPFHCDINTVYHTCGSCSEFTRRSRAKPLWIKRFSLQYYNNITVVVNNAAKSFSTVFGALCNIMVYTGNIVILL